MSSKITTRVIDDHILQEYTTIQQQLNEKDKECCLKIDSLVSEKQSLCKTLADKESQIESLTAEVALSKTTDCVIRETNSRETTLGTR